MLLLPRSVPGVCWLSKGVSEETLTLTVDLEQLEQGVDNIMECWPAFCASGRLMLARGPILPVSIPLPILPGSALPWSRAL